jgi:hypothetical protein
MSKKTPWEPHPKNPEVIPLPDHSMKSWTGKEIADDLPNIEPADIDASAQKMRDMLAGHNPIWQGAVLCDLLAMWLGGHNPEQRDELLTLHIERAKALVEMYDPWKQVGADG